MGVCSSTEQHSSPEHERSRQFDKQIREDERKMSKEAKLLLLGAGDSGKSTILKSMRVIHSIPFTEEEQEDFRRLIFRNVVEGMQMVIEYMRETGGAFEHSENGELAQLLNSTPDIEQGQAYPLVFHNALRQLWSDAGVQTVFERGNEAAIPENMSYYYADLDRLFQPTYRPNEGDILRCRIKTTGIIETRFSIQDRVYRIFDVGGQRSERKKWIHCFEDVTAVLFIVALSGYDCSLSEDRNANQMQESFMLFDAICNSKWFTRTSMILFLNKVDIFKAKIERSPVRKYFPDYKGKEGDYDASRMYFRDRFLRLNKGSKEIYPSFTTATDPKLLKIVMASVTDIIITTHLKQTLL